MFQVVAQGPDGSGGIMGMYDITVISIVVACIVSLVREMGGITFLLQMIKTESRKNAAQSLVLQVLPFWWTCARQTIRLLLS